MRYAACILVWLVAAGQGITAPPKSPGQVKAKVGEIIEVEIEQDAAGRIGFHNPYSATDLFVRQAVPRRDKTIALLIQPKKEQVYNLTLWTVGEDTGVTLAVDASGEGVIPPNPQPNPNPNPQPNPPTPNPPVTLKDPWVIVVEESSARTADVAKVLNDLTFWKSIPSSVAWRFYDKDSPDAKKYKYDTLAAQTGLAYPVLMVLDDKGNLIKSRTLPTSTAEVRTFIKENTGH